MSANKVDHARLHIVLDKYWRGSPGADSKIESVPFLIEGAGPQPGAVPCWQRRKFTSRDSKAMEYQMCIL